MVNQGKFVAHYGHPPVNTHSRTYTGLKSGSNMSVSCFFNIIITNEFSSWSSVRGDPTDTLRAFASAIIIVLVEPSPTCLCSWSRARIRNPLPNCLPEYTDKMPDQRFPGVIYLKALRYHSTETEQYTWIAKPIPPPPGRSGENLFISSTVR